MYGKGFPVKIGERPGVLRKPEGEAVGVQRLSGLTVRAVQFVCTVLAVTQQGTADRRHMRTDLMRAAGEQFALDLSLIHI